MYYELEIVLIIAMLIIGFYDDSDLAALRKWWSGKESFLKRNNLIKVKAKNSGGLQRDI